MLVGSPGASGDCTVLQGLELGFGPFPIPSQVISVPFKHAVTSSGCGEHAVQLSDVLAAPHNLLVVG